MSKSTALMSGLILIALFGGLTFWLPDRASNLGVIVGAIVTLVSAYIGFQVANNGVKGKFFNQALYDAEHPKEEI
ncbi:MAG: hypothetical protein LBU66_02655 [Treponema sp.]|jgi:hypothetical protein|nr:hypothetical protein [Treponema sp.]